MRLVARKLFYLVVLVWLGSIVAANAQPLPAPNTSLGDNPADGGSIDATGGAGGDGGAGGIDATGAAGGDGGAGGAADNLSGDGGTGGDGGLPLGGV